MPARLGHRAVLDGLRGIAILLVLARHTFPATFGGAGFTGVGLFFVLSGFLITSLLIEEGESTGKVSFRRFYARRALRLLPALYAFLTVALVLVLTVLPAETRTSSTAWRGYAAVYVTPFFRWAGAEPATGMGMVWSLAVEEYFYFIWPILLVNFVLPLRSWFRPIAPLTLAAISISIRWITWTAAGPRIYEMPWTWTDGLLIGCATALARQAGWFEKAPRVLVAALGSAGTFGLIAFSLWEQAKSASFTYGPGLSLLFIAAAFLVVASIERPIWLIERPLKGRVLTWFGRRSYAIYLWNGLFLVAQKPFAVERWVEIAVGVPATLALAELSWRLVESPALRQKQRFQSGANAREPGAEAKQTAA